MDRLTSALTTGIVAGMTIGFWRWRATPIAPRRPAFPAGFKSRKAWLAWCEEDRRSGLAEQMEDVWTQDFASGRGAA